MKISIIGCGWLGLPLGELLVKKGYQVMGSTTSLEKLELLKSKGIEPYQIIIDPEVRSNSGLDNFFKTDVLIINFPPGRRPDAVAYHSHQIQSLKELILKNKVARVLFVSSSSVYPDVNREVTEEETLVPTKESGEALRIAESLLFEETSFKTSVIRFGGLFGDDRQPGRFLANKKNVLNAEAPVNLIHLYDCIHLIKEIIDQEAWGEVFNAAADLHPSRKEFYTRAAIVAGLTPPEFSESDEPRFKIINSEKIKKRLNYHFKYPDPLKAIEA
jgi:nucleoside-diphosphate-sugar epimerase